jgi:methionyl-tRNA formyltransferase
VPQDDTQATYTTLLTRANGQIDWTQPATYIERMSRAYDPWPGAFTLWRGQPLRVIEAHASSVVPEAAAPGTLVLLGSKLAVATGEGALELVRVQPAGKREMAAGDWLRGQRDAIGQQLGV